MKGKVSCDGDTLVETTSATVLPIPIVGAPSCVELSDRDKGSASGVVRTDVERLVARC